MAAPDLVEARCRKTAALFPWAIGLAYSLLHEKAEPVSEENNPHQTVNHP